MLLNRIALVTLIGTAIAASSSVAMAQLNRSTPPSTLPNQQPCAALGMMGPGMMGRGMMMHGYINSEQDYLSEMIPHHQEAIATAQQVLKRSDRPEMKAFARDIIRVQSAEVEQMRQWLKAWYPDQQTLPSYHNMMRDLSQLQGNELDQAFLQDMIAHHREAVRMSHQLLHHNLIQNEALRPFSAQIASSQMQEMHQMQAWLRDWFGANAGMGSNRGMNGSMGGMGRMHRVNFNR